MKISNKGFGKYYFFIKFGFKRYFIFEFYRICGKREKFKLVCGYKDFI